MKKLFKICLYTLLVIIVSCSNDPLLSKMEQIKILGNDNPEKGLAMLDSLEIEVREEDDYVQNKFDLLHIRLCDKANILPISDIKIKSIVQYFEKKGDLKDQQEAYYYAGSVYRDLMDTPRALEYFFKSIDCTTDNHNCDSIMLRNTYSNIVYLQGKVHNYKDAVYFATEELRIEQELGLSGVVAYMQLGAAYYAVDSLENVTRNYDKAYDIILHKKDKSQYQETLIRLLCDYSELNVMDKAKRCKMFVHEHQQDEYLSSLKDFSFARYYEACGESDSATFYYNRIIDNKEDADNMYDAAKHLYSQYAKGGDVAKASLYAGIFLSLSDSLDYGKRQELAATVNNAYKYHLDEKKEQMLNEEKEKYRSFLVLVVCISIILIIVGFLLYIKRRNRYLEELLHLSLELKQVKMNFEDVNSELDKYNRLLEEKESQLSEKIEQNKLFLRLLHQSELELNAESVIETIRNSSMGRKQMSNVEWRQLYNSVDELYPDFKDMLIKEIGSFTEQQMQVFYLMRIGLSRTQIQNITNLSRVTIWRWTKKYNWCFYN